MKRTTRKNPYAFKSAKMERQYQELRKRFNLTRAEFAEYYQNIRKANYWKMPKSYVIPAHNFMVEISREIEVKDETDNT